MKRIDNEFFGVPNADTDFNLDAAVDAYHRVMNMGDEAEFVVRSVMYDQMDADFTAVRKSAQALIDNHVQTTVATAQKALAKRISKGVDPAAYGAAVVLTEISKAYGKDQYNRDVRGRFSHVEQRKFNYEGTKKIKDSVVNQMAPKDSDISTKHLDPQTAAKMQQAYVGLAQMLQRARQYGVPASDVLVELTHEDGSTTTQYGTDAGKALRSSINSGNPIVQADLHVDSGLSAAGAAFDVMKPLGRGGAMGAEAFRTASDASNPDNFTQFANAWNSQESNPREPNKRAYGRIASAAQFLESNLPEGTPGKVRLAVAAGKWVGQHGPEAEKVLGPGARKASYRYRGIERKPDAELLRTASAALTGVDNPNERRRMLIYGDRNAVVGYNKLPGSTKGSPITQDVESPVVEYFTSRLPDPALLKLQTESGQVPPSEGVIIDRNGKIVTQAVGYGDDHYLPFNLKNLSKLQGGEYVRTRAVGGLTTEDIYAGLVSGARAVTVVSNSGVYTMEFDPTFRGGRRFNDKAARMVGRYGMLLDSVKSETITLQNIPPDRYAELKEQAIARYPDESEEGDRTQYLTTLTEREKRDPKMSAAGKDAVALQVLDDYAAAHATADGVPKSWDEIKSQRIHQASIAAANASYPGEAGDEKISRIEAARDRAAADLDDPQSAIASLGLGDRYEKSLARAEHDYRASQRPLKLNSDGYFAAQRALKEQFPYYISRTEMRPKKLPGADDKHVGYVNPRFNRPAAARVGYFDPNIDGAGAQGAQGSKVSAQFINYQNAANSPGRAPAPAAKAERTSTSDEPERPKFEVNERVLKDAALEEMLKHINEQTVIGAKATAAQGLSVHDPGVAAGLNKDYGNVWGATSVPTDPTLRAKMEAEIHAMIRDKVFDLDEGKVGAFKGQKVAAAKKIDGDSKDFLTEYLYGSNVQVSFKDGSAAYEGKLTNPGSYEAKYQDLVHPENGNIYVARLGLGDTLAYVTDAAIAAKKAEIKKKYTAYEMEKAAFNASPEMGRKLSMTPEKAKQEIDQPAKALAKVEMLHRHYQASLPKTKVDPEVPVVNEYHLHTPGSPAAEAFQAKWAEQSRPQDAGRAVQGSIEGDSGIPLSQIIPGWTEARDRTR